MYPHSYICTTLLLSPCESCDLNVRLIVVTLAIKSHDLLTFRRGISDRRNTSKPKFSAQHNNILGHDSIRSIENKECYRVYRKPIELVMVIR